MAASRKPSPSRHKRRKSGFSRFGFWFIALLAAATAVFFVPTLPLSAAYEFTQLEHRLLTIHMPRTDYPARVLPVAAALPAPAPFDPAAADLPNPEAPLTIARYREHGVPFLLIEGGVAGTRRSPMRQEVDDFVKSSGAAAGLNGTFFANASLSGTDNLLIGPSLCGNEAQFVLSPYDKKPTLTGRPLVLMAPNRTRIIPYDIATMDDEAAIRSELPGLTDAFLGGVWLVHNGIAVTPTDLAKYQIRDANDPRRRAFFALTDDGRPALGATSYVATSQQLARALQAVGIREAVLLDSGFSTSLVYGDKILVTGHTAPGIPSRPVPHAIVLFDLNATKIASNIPASGE